MSHHVLFDTDPAEEYGIQAAIMAANIRYWILRNQGKKGSHREGRNWMYQSAQKWADDQLPFMSKAAIERALKKLVKAGVLTTGRFNKKGYDRTTWYAFTDESIWLERPVMLHATKTEYEETEEATKMEHAYLENEAPIPIGKHISTTTRDEAEAEPEPVKEGPFKMHPEWNPCEATVNRLLEHGYSLNDPLKHLQDHREYFASTGKKKLQKNWNQTYANAVKRQVKHESKNPQGTSHGKTSPLTEALDNIVQQDWPG